MVKGVREKRINCQRCNAEILVERLSAKYCDSCKLISRRESQKRYRKTHREEKLEYDHQRRIKHGGSPGYFYVNCEKRDCDWIDSQLNTFRKENIRGDDEKENAEREAFYNNRQPI